jgi:hypothetical protein
MSDKVEVRSVGFSLPTLLTVLFVGLKLTDNIDWSWVWVLSPLWISASIGVTILLVIGLFFLIFGA